MAARPKAALPQRVAEIVRATTVPVTVDIEDGYSDDTHGVSLRPHQPIPPVSHIHHGGDHR